MTLNDFLHEIQNQHYATIINFKLFLNVLDSHASLENVSFIQKNQSIDVFLSPLVTTLVLSFHEFNGNFAKLENLLSIETLVLCHVGLQSVAQIDFGNLKLLKYLDLSHN